MVDTARAPNGTICEGPEVCCADTSSGRRSHRLGPPHGGTVWSMLLAFMPIEFSKRTEVTPQERRDWPWIIGAFIMLGLAVSGAVIHRLLA
jgi:hypothetical protein